MEVAEYQRQICLPNVPKFSTALLSLVDKHPEQEVKVSSPVFLASSRYSILAAACAEHLDAPRPLVPYPTPESPSTSLINYSSTSEWFGAQTHAYSVGPWSIASLFRPPCDRGQGGCRKCLAKGP